MSGWRDHAACLGRDGELWFVEQRSGDQDVAATNAALAACGTADNPACPSRAACLAFALTIEGSKGVEHRAGIYGGLTGQERRRLQHNAGRRAARAKAAEAAWAALVAAS